MRLLNVGLTCIITAVERHEYYETTQCGPNMYNNCSIET